jgi:hypothetical protein
MKTNTMTSTRTEVVKPPSKRKIVLNDPKMGTEERLTLVKGITRAVASRVVSELTLEENLKQRGYEFEVGREHRIYVRFKGAKSRTIQGIAAELMSGVEVHDLILEEGRERVSEAIDYLDQKIEKSEHQCKTQKPWANLDELNRQRSSGQRPDLGAGRYQKGSLRICVCSEKG